MHRIGSRSNALIEALLVLSLLTPSLSQLGPTCRGPNNVPAQNPKCRDAKCQAEELTFAFCSDDTAGSGKASMSLQILIRREDENVTVTAVEVINTQLVPFHHWITRLDDCSGCDLLIVSIGANIPNYRYLAIRVETAAKVVLYGLHFTQSPKTSLTSDSGPSEWVIVLGYVLQASKMADGKILPDNVDRLAVIVSSPRPESLQLKNENVHIRLRTTTSEGSKFQVINLTMNMSTCKAVWCVLDTKQLIDSISWLAAMRSEAMYLMYDLPERARIPFIVLQISLSLMWNYTEPGKMAGTRESIVPDWRANGAARDSCIRDQPAGSCGLSAPQLLLVLVGAVAGVAAVCSVPLCIVWRQRHRSNRRILLIASASPHCLRQLQRQRRLPLSHDQEWRQLCKRAQALGYHLMVIDCRQPIEINYLHSMITACTRVLILSDETERITDESDENPEMRQLPQVLQRLALMEKHRCTLLQWQQKLTQQLLYASIRHFLDEVIGNNKKVPAEARGVNGEVTDRATATLLPAAGLTPGNSACGGILHV